MDVRKFLGEIGYMCGANEPARVGRIAELVFDDEIKAEWSPFSRNTNDLEKPYNRMELLFGFKGDEKCKAQCMRLLRIAELQHYKGNHKFTPLNQAELDSVIVEATAAESDTEVAPVTVSYTVESVVTSSSGWNG